MTDGIDPYHRQVGSDNYVQKVSIEASQVAFTATVDSEFPAAATLGDATANPSTTNVEALLGVFNGTTWDRARGDIANGQDVDVTRLPGRMLFARPPITVSTSPAYSIGDNVGGVVSVTGAVQSALATGELVQITLTDLANQKAQYEIRFFGANPAAGTYTDNAATVLHATDQAHALGRVTVYPSDWTTTGSIATATLRNIGLGLQAESGTTVYMVITTGAVTGAPAFATVNDLVMLLTIWAH